jgi:hypothetical protein
MHDAPDLEVRYRNARSERGSCRLPFESFLFRRQFAAGRLAVRRDEPETEIREIADGVREGQDVRQAGLPECLRVVDGAWQRV